jgi:hypothetical protein
MCVGAQNCLWEFVEARRGTLGLGDACIVWKIVEKG